MTGSVLDGRDGAGERGSCGSDTVGCLRVEGAEREAERRRQAGALARKTREAGLEASVGRMQVILSRVGRPASAGK